MMKTATRAGLALPEVGAQVPRRGNTFTVWLGQTALRLSGWRIEGTLPDVPRAVVICAPHTSNRDGLVVAAAILALRLRIGIFAKHTLFTWPMGPLFRWLGALPIDRTRAGGIVGESVARFAEREQLWVGMAPEGTRKASPAWKAGFHHIARQAGVPVIAAVLDYGNRVLRLPPLLEPGDDLDADMAWALGCFAGVQPAKPARLSLPLRGGVRWDGAGPDKGD